MKNFYEVASSDAIVMTEDDSMSLMEAYTGFVDESYREGEQLELEYQGSPLVIEILEQYGGEGMGDTYYVVFSVTYMNETTNYKLDGWYASHYGHEFHNWEPYEVEKREVVREEWFRKNN